MSDVDVSKLTITSETGSVTLSSIEGHIKAQSDVEEIKTSESLSSEIIKGDTIGQSLDNNIGNATNEVLVHTNASCININ